jgi:hypothetical protein
MATLFPRTEVAGVSLPRMLIGTNWICGYSHTSPAADSLITGTHCGTPPIGKLLDATASMPSWLPASTARAYCGAP